MTGHKRKTTIMSTCGGRIARKSWELTEQEAAVLSPTTRKLSIYVGAKSIAHAIATDKLIIVSYIGDREYIRDKLELIKIFACLGNLENIQLKCVKSTINYLNKN